MRIRLVNNNTFVIDWFEVVLCFSPVGSTLRIRSRKFPAITNCTSIDWFHEWPEEALVSVSQKFLSEVELLTVRASFYCVQCLVVSSHTSSFWLVSLFSGHVLMFFAVQVWFGLLRWNSTVCKSSYTSLSPASRATQNDNLQVYTRKYGSASRCKILFNVHVKDELS